MCYPKPEKTWLVLLHYPVYNKNGDVITSAITNLDIHDMARVVQTYGLAGYYLINPITSQFRLLEETIEFWQDGLGQEYNPTRSHSFGVVKAAKHLSTVRKAVGKNALWIATTARRYENCVSCADIRKMSEADPQRNLVIMLGTGFGLTDEFIESYEHIMCPIEAGTPYNHLSVRSAASIIIDRLFGK